MNYISQSVNYLMVYILWYINLKKQVRLSRATLEFQVHEVSTGLNKVFNSQVIYLISFAEIFKSKKSSFQALSL